jgi:uncharacterized protein YraI
MVCASFCPIPCPSFLYPAGNIFLYNFVIRAFKKEIYMAKSRSLLITILMFVLLTVSCAPTITTLTPAPILTEGPSIPVTGMASVGSAEIQIVSSDPLQINAILRGQLPDSGCTTISSVQQAREGNTFRMTLNTITTNDPAVSCLQVLTPFEQVVPLETGNLQPGQYVVNANGFEQSFEVPAASVEQFRQVLLDALNARDYEKVKSLMEPSFTIAYWGSDGSANTPEQAIEQLQRNLLNASSSIVADPNKDFSTLVRSDPVTSGNMEASFACADKSDEFCVTIRGTNEVKASPLFTSGWGASGRDEAILFMAKRSNGEPYWYGLLYAKDGFVQPTPVVVATQPATLDTKAYATQVKYVLALQYVRIRSGPDTRFNVIGFIAAGRTAKVTGVNANGAWWQVICPNNLVANCWVSAATDLTRPSNGPLPDNSAYPTSVQYVMAQRDVNIYNGPGSQYSVVGFVAAGQTAKVTGVSADKNWWRVVCPVPVPSNCWVSANTSQTRPIELGRKADVQSVEAVVLQTRPIQVNAIARGTLPDAGCTTIAGASQSRNGNTFIIVLTTKVNANVMCAQVITPFEYVIPLDVSSLVPGHYIVDVNGVEGSFDLPASYP